MAIKELPELPAAVETVDTDLYHIRQGDVDKKLTLEILKSIVAPDATESNKGIIEIATQSETNTGSDDARAVTPLKLHNRTATESRTGITSIATQTEVDNGTNDTKFVSPLKLNNKQASTTMRGVIELATNTETQTGSDSVRAVTPASLESKTATEARRGIARLASQAQVNAGNNGDTIVTPLTLQSKINGAVPSGVILLWSGSVASIPAGYALCDGASGTPDLRDRFVVGAGGGFSVGSTGGSTSFNTNTTGNHNHGGSTSNHTLSLSQIPSHGHHLVVNTFNSDIRFNPNDGIRRQLSFRGEPEYNLQGEPATPTLGRSSLEGGNAGHSHGLSTDGNHSHSISNVRPPYYALAYIMKL